MPPILMVFWDRGQNTLMKRKLQNLQKWAPILFPYNKDTKSRTLWHGLRKSHLCLKHSVPGFPAAAPDDTLGGNSIDDPSADGVLSFMKETPTSLKLNLVK